MKTVFCFAAAIAAAVALSAVSAKAQGPGGRGRGFGMGRGGAMDPTILLRQDSVQKELELSDDQKTKITDLADSARQKMRDLFTSGAAQDEMQTKMQDLAKENKSKVDEILLPNQIQRLDEIALQFSLEQGFAAGALTQDDVAKKLGLSDEQKQKLETVASDAREKMRDMFSGGGPPDQQEMAKVRTESKDKAMDVLTAEQKATLEKMEGKKFDVSSIQMFGRGRRGGGGGGQGGNN